MTPKERLLQMETYEEYEKNRKELAGLKPDKEVIAHLSKLFGKMSDTKEEFYSYLSDGRRVLGGNGKQRNQITKNESNYRE